MDSLSAMIDEQFYSVDATRVYAKMIHYIEMRVIEKALELSGGNRAAAAKTLGLHRNTLRSKIKKFGIDVGRYK